MSDDINTLTGRIIKAYYVVYNTLGFGFLERVYENAMVIELKKEGLHGRRQVPVQVHYGNEMVGNYFGDIFVEDRVVLELKAAEALCEEHELQLLNYLRATNIEYGLLLNFGKKPEIRRKIFENKYKKSVQIR